MTNVKTKLPKKGWPTINPGYQPLANPISERMRVFDAYQHFLFYFEQPKYESEKPHGEHLTKHFAEKLNGLRHRYCKNHMIEGNTPEVLVNWIQEMTLDNQAIMMNRYILPEHGSDEKRTKWGREL